MSQLPEPEASGPAQTSSFWRAQPGWAVLGLAGIAFGHFLWMFLITWLRHRAWFTENYDIAIFNQATWLLAHGETPFVTVRIINIFGDHASLNLLLLAPLSRLWPFAPVTFLYFVQAAVVSLSAVPLYRLGRLAGVRPGLALCGSGAFALSPLTQNVGYEFHPEALAIPLLLWAVVAAWEERWVVFGVAAGLAALAKEDIPLVLVFLGLWVWLVRRHRRAGLVTMAAAAAVFLIETRLLIPAAGGGYLYYGRFAEFGQGAAQILVGMATHPHRVLGGLLGTKGLPYLAVLAVCMPLALLAPRMLIPAVPTVLINVLSGFPPQRNIENHYIAPALAFLAAASMLGLGTLDRLWARVQVDAPTRGRGVAALAGLALLPALATNLLFSSAQPDRPAFRDVVQRSPHTDRLEEAARLIPPDAVVSAGYYQVAHVSDRPVVYFFPVPFAYPPFQELQFADQEARIRRVEYVFVDRNVGYYARHDSNGLFGLPAGETWDTVARFWQGWQILYDDDGVLVARRPP